MKIAYVIDYLYSVNGGTERQLYILIEGMVSRGHTVDLYVFRDTEFTKNLLDFPCPVHCLNVESVLSPGGLIRLIQFRKRIIADNVDVLHGFFNDVALSLPPLMLGSNVKTFTSRRDMGIWYSPAKLLFLRLFRFASIRLICNSIAVAKFTFEQEWKAKESIRVIYNGMNRFNVDPSSCSCDWAPEKGKNINIILVANVRPVKRVEDLIRAASLVAEHGYHPQYYVVGHLQSDGYTDSLRALLRQHHLEGDFHFTGPVSEPRGALERFDIGVLTSASEGFSNTLMEYLDAGLPVVASRVGGNPELVADGETGFLYEAGDVNALADCILKLIEDDRIRNLFAANAKQMITRFDRATMIETHEKEYLCA